MNLEEGGGGELREKRVGGVNLERRGWGGGELREKRVGG